MTPFGRWDYNTKTYVAGLAFMPIPVTILLLEGGPSVMRAIILFLVYAIPGYAVLTVQSWIGYRWTLRDSSDRIRREFRGAFPVDADPEQIGDAWAYIQSELEARQRARWRPPGFGHRREWWK